MELHAFEKMSASNSDQKSISSSLSKEGEIWKLGKGKLYSFHNYHSSKK